MDNRTLEFIKKSEIQPRETKYRYWNEVSGIYVTTPKMPEKYGWTITKLFEERGWTWLQFTGKVDVNGIEIFEHDILKHHGVVAWNEVENKWSCIDLNWNDRKEWHDMEYLTSQLVVVGNIYENPELL